MSTSAHPSRATLPPELLYDICAQVVVEYIDMAVAGPLIPQTGSLETNYAHRAMPLKRDICSLLLASKQIHDVTEKVFQDIFLYDQPDDEPTFRWRAVALVSSIIKCIDCGQQGLRILGERRLASRLPSSLGRLYVMLCATQTMLTAIIESGGTEAVDTFKNEAIASLEGQLQLIRPPVFREAIRKRLCCFLQSWDRVSFLYSMRNKLDLLRQAVFGASKGSEKRKDALTETFITLLALAVVPPGSPKNPYAHHEFSTFIKVVCPSVTIILGYDVDGDDIVQKKNLVAMVLDEWYNRMPAALQASMMSELGVETETGDEDEWEDVDSDDDGDEWEDVDSENEE